jgi:hypothetical protein
MSVPKQHTRVAMPTEKRDFRNTQSGLEETTDGLVPKIVKPEIRQSNSAHDTPPSHLHRVFRRRKYPLVSGHSVATTLQDGESAPRQRDRARVTIFRGRDQESSLVEIYVRPARVQHFRSAHGGG